MDHNATARVPPSPRRRRRRSRPEEAISSHVEHLPARTPRQRIADAARAAASPIVRALVRAGVTANVLTVLGLAVTGVAAWLIVERRWVAAGVVFSLGSLMDMLDGSVARLSGRASPVGAFLDSTADRIADGAVLGAIAVVMAHQGNDWGLAAALVALVAGFAVSYARARAEGLGVATGAGGLMSRPERIVVIALGIFLGDYDRVLAIIVAVLAALSTVTVGQRVVHVCRALRERERREGSVSE